MKDSKSKAVKKKYGPQSKGYGSYNKRDLRDMMEAKRAAGYPIHKGGYKITTEDNNRR